MPSKAENRKDRLLVRGVRIFIFLIAAILSASPFLSAAQSPQSSRQPPPPLEKTSRTLAQQKINSQLLQEIDRLRGRDAPERVPSARTGVKLDEKHRALVDVRAEVNPGLQQKIRSIKGTIVSTSREYRTIVAWLPLLTLERLAEDPRVSAISPQAQPVMQR
jgi:hypothetical protein